MAPTSSGPLRPPKRARCHWACNGLCAHQQFSARSLPVQHNSLTKGIPCDIHFEFNLEEMPLSSDSFGSRLSALSLCNSRCFVQQLLPEATCGHETRSESNQATKLAGYTETSSGRFIEGRCRYAKKPASFPFKVHEVAIGLSFLDLAQLFPQAPLPNAASFLQPRRNKCWVGGAEPPGI